MALPKDAIPVSEMPDDVMPIAEDGVFLKATRRGELENRAKLAEEKVAQRKSFIKEGVPSIDELKKHPLGGLLRSLGIGFEVAEGVPSSALLALQRGEPGAIMPDILKTLVGERPAQIGDVFRESRIPILSSEPAASTLGLLMTGIPKTPTALLGSGVAKGISEAFKISQIPKLISRFGRPAISKTLSVLSRVPEEDVAQALDNPQILSRRFLNTEGQVVKQIYSDTIKPNIENLSNRVNTNKILPTLEDIKLTIGEGGELTRQATTMRPAEREKILRWLDDIKRGEMSLNKTDAMIGEMDEGLGKVYSNIEKGKTEPITRTFEALTLKMRRGLKELRDTQFEKLTPLFKRYENYKNAEKVYQAFDRVFPYIYNLASVEALIHFSGLGKALGAVGPWAGVLTSPKIQAAGIQGVSALGKAITKAPTLVEEALIKTQK